MMMGSRGLNRRFCGIAAVAGALFGATTVHAQAQNVVITGSVTNEQGAIVKGANVVIPSLGISVGTGENGQYTLTVPGPAAGGRFVAITARYIGFSPLTKQVTLSGSPVVNFNLSVDVRRLEEVVVTGVAQATSIKNTTISISKLSVNQIDKVPALNPISAIAGKVAGAQVSLTQGNPGASPAIRLRGSTNLGIGNNSPLFIVDGVITKQSLSDIDANDIESIEILKGAASANTYGSDAANGVIAITTKRGKNLPDNKLSFLVRSELGTSSIGHFVPQATHHYYVLNPDGSFARDKNGDLQVEADHVLDNPYPAGTLRDQLKTYLRDGSFSNNYATLGLRRGNTNFASSFSLDKDEGVLQFVQGFRRRNLRINLDQSLTSKADFSISTLYGLSNNDQSGSTVGSTALGTFFQLLQAPPNIDLKHPNGDSTQVDYYPKLPAEFASGDRGNPLYKLLNEQYNNRRERILGSFTGRYRPFGWLTIDGTYGTDRLNQNIRQYQFRGFLNTQGAPTTGYYDLYTNNDVADNSQVNATVTGNVGGLNSTTRLTYLYENENNGSFEPSCSKLNIGQTPTLNACDPTQTSVTSYQATIRSRDYFVTQGLNFRDRYIAQLLLRQDQSSLFGSQDRSRTFYGLSGAYRISQDFTIPGIQELKIRAARGTAGLRPSFSNQYEVYNIGGGQASKAVLGNAALKPAIQLENELGVDVSFLQHFDVEVVKSDRRTTGAFLSVPLSAAQSGGYTSQVQNAATVSGSTLEGSLNTRVFDSKNINYNFTLTATRTRQRIDELDRAPFRVGSSVQGQNIFYYKAGEPLGIIYGTRWVRSLNELKDNPANIADPTFDVNNYVINEDGYVVLAANKGTVKEVPIKYVNPAIAFNGQYKIADVNPDYTFGFANTLRYKGFTLYGLLDGTRGGAIYNYTKQYMIFDLRAGVEDQAGKPAAAKKPYDYYNAFYNGNEPNSYFVENGSYVKLRELSVSYTLGDNVLNTLHLNRVARSIKVAMIGRNLYTWTKYSGFDPEASSDGDFNFRIDGFRYPQFRQLTGQLEIGF